MYDYKGNFDFVDRNINESTGAILVQGSFPNPDNILRPGLYAKVSIMFSYDRGSFVIPQRSVIETQGQYSVMVVTDSNTIVSRQVQVGESFDGKWQIHEGLNVENILFLKAFKK